MTALENEVRIVHTDAAAARAYAAAAGADAAAARVLAGGADRDTADLKVKLDAHTKVLNALRETQLEQGERLNSLETKFDRLETEMQQGVAKLGAGMAYITTLLERDQ